MQMWKQINKGKKQLIAKLRVCHLPPLKNVAELGIFDEDFYTKGHPSMASFLFSWGTKCRHGYNGIVFLGFSASMCPEGKEGWLLSEEA